MSNAKLRYNPAHDAFEVQSGDDIWCEEILADDDFMILPSESGGNSLCVILEGSQLEGVEANTVYELVKVKTELAPDGEFPLDGEEVEEEEN